MNRLSMNSVAGIEHTKWKETKSGRKNDSFMKKRMKSSNNVPNVTPKDSQLHLKHPTLKDKNNNVSLTTISDEHMVALNMLYERFHINMTRGLSSSRAKQILKETGKNTFQPPTDEGKFTRDEWLRLVGQRIPAEVCVFRDGQKQWVPGRKIVRGDLVILKKHQFVPADIRVIDSKDLVVDNCLITGNRAEPKTHDVYTLDCLLSPNMVFCCTKVVEGCCVGVVLRRGDDTVFGTLKNFATRVKFEALMP